MLLRHVNGLSRARIVLASGSPRRRELLGSMGLRFEVIQLMHAETSLISVLETHCTCRGNLVALPTRHHPGMSHLSALFVPPMHVALRRRD